MARRKAPSSDSRAVIAAWMSSLKKQKMPRPIDLARYIAMSVRRTRPSRSTSSVGYIEMPMLTEITMSSSPTTMGALSASSRRWAMSAASSAPPRLSAMTVNSSPPRREMVKLLSSPVRATESMQRRQPPSFLATCCKRRSPASCPRLSLTTLKRSRSRNISAKGRPLLCARCIARSSRLRNRARLGNPVRLSKLASCTSRSCASRRSLMSRRRTSQSDGPFEPDGPGMGSKWSSIGTLPCSRCTMASPLRSVPSSSEPGSWSMWLRQAVPRSCAALRWVSLRAASLQATTRPAASHSSKASAFLSNSTPSRRSASRRRHSVASSRRRTRVACPALRRSRHWLSSLACQERAAAGNGGRSSGGRRVDAMALLHCLIGHPAPALSARA